MHDPSLIERVWEALNEVIDPELGIPITDLGLVYEVEVDEDVVRVTMTTTTPVCPLGDYLSGVVSARLDEMSDVDNVVVRLTNEPPWSIERLSEKALRILGSA